MNYCSPLTILLIDDCAEQRVAYCRLLQQDSLYTYRILEFETATEAMNWCQQEIPDVILLDFLLPDRKGLEFLEQFREHISNTQSAVIILAEQGDADSAVHAMKSGAQDYLVKDKLTPEILQRSIHSTVERLHLTRQIEQSREQQQLIATIALRIRQSLKLQEILSVTTTEVRQFLKADRVIVYQFHPDMSGTIVAESVLPGWTEVLGQLIQETYFQQGGATEYCQGRKQVIDDIYQAGLTDCHLQLLEQLEVKANLVVPILVTDQLWGLLVAQQCSASRHWQSMELDLLDQLAVQIAIAIQQASTYEQLQTELAQRQRIEETLRQSEEQFRSTFEQVAVGMCHVSFDGQFLRFNQRFCDIAGYSQAELLTLTFQEITHPDDLAFDLEMMQNLLSGKIQTYSLEKRYICKDRSLIWSTLTVSLVRDRFGEPQYLISVVEDITTRKLAEEALRRSEAKSRAILAAIPDLMFQTNAEGVYLGYVTPHRTSDLLPQIVDPTGRRMSDVLPPDLAQRQMERIERALHTDELQTYEQQVQIGDRLQDEEVRVIKSGDDEVLFMIRDISDRKQAEAALFQLAAIVESSEDAIISNTLDGVIVSWNVGAEKLFGYTAQEVIGQLIFLLIPTDRKNEESQILEKIKRGERVEHFETVRQRKDGTLIDISLTISPVKDATGKVVGASKIARDVSARKLAEEELRRAERLQSELHLLENILEVSLAGYFDWDIPGDREYLSPTFKRMFGYEDHELPNTPQTWQRLIFPEDLLRLLECLDQHIKSRGQIPYYNEVRYRHKNGSTVWVICSGRVIEWDQDGYPLRMIGCHIDITERKQTEQALKESEERWQLALRGSNDGIWDWNSNTNRVFVSTRWKEMRGFADDEIGDYIRCEEWSDAIHSDDRDRVLRALADHLAGKTPFFREEYQVKRKDGSYLWILDRGQALWDEADNAVRMAGSESDISDRKQIEQALRQNEARHRAIVEDQTELIARFLPDATIVFVNEAYCRYFRLQREEILGKSYEPVIFEEDQETVAQLLQSMSRENPTVTIENRVVVKGEIHWTQWINRMLFDEQGQFVELQSVGRDITDLKRIEATLKRYERIVSTAKDGIALLDRNYTYQVVNQAYLDWCNKSYSEVRGHSVRDILGLELFEQFIKPRLDRCLAGETVQYEKWFNYPNLVPQFLSVSYVPYLDADQNISGIVVSLRDLTDLQRTEDALRISEERLKLALEGSGDGLWDWNIVTGEVYLNANWLEMLGYAENELPHHVSTWERLIHPDDQLRVGEMLNAHLKDGSAPYSFDYRVLTKSGKWKWVANYGKVVARDENGAPLRMVGTHKDISDRKQTEEQLRTLSERLTLALKSGGFGIWEYDFLLDKLIWDDRMYELYGVTPDNFVNTLTLDTWINCLHPDERDGVLETIQQLLQQDKDYNTEFRLIQPSGKIRFLKTYGILQRDKQGNPVRLVGVNFDITHQKLAEVALRESERRFATLAEASPVGIFRFDTAGNCIYVNNRWCEMTGRSLQEGLGMGWVQTIHPQDGDRMLREWFQWSQSLKQGRLYQNEGRLLRPDDRIMWINCQMLRETDPSGTLLGYVGILTDITERKQTEEQLQNLSDRLALALKSGAIGIWEWDVVRDVLIWDDRIYELYGLQPSDLVGTLDEAWTKGVHPKDLAQAKAAVRQSLQDEKEFDTEFRIVRPDGSIRFIKASALVQRNNFGQPQRMVGINYDITDRKQAEQELEESRTMLQSVLDTIPQRVFWKDRQSRYLGCNPAFAHDYQLTPDTIIGKTDLELPWAKWASLYREDDAVVMNTGIPKLGYQEQTEGHNGEQLWLRTSKVPLSNSAGEVIGVLGSYEDITAGKQAQEELAKYAREVEDLYNKAPCGYHSLDIEGRFVNVNQTELDWLGYTREEMIGKPFTDLITAAGQSVFEQNYPRFKERGWVKDLEYDMVCKDGTILPVLLNATAVKSAEGTYLYNRATLFDIRDRKRAQQELQELNTAMQNAVEGISRVDIHGHYVSINRAYANLCGYEPEELIGQPWQQTVYSEDIPDLLAAYQQMLETGKVEAEARGIRKEGSLFYKQVTMVTIHDQEGTVTGHHCFMKDISDRKYAEAQLRQTNAQLAHATRLKDEFLANMSHELRTPLNAVLGMSEGLQEGVFGSVNERQVKAIEIIERSGKHLLELINDILDLSKIESGKLELQISDVWVRSLCDGSLAFIKQMALKKNIHLSTRIPDNVGSIQSDARRLRQVLINLLSNAVKFTPEDGSVTLEVRLEQAEEHRSTGAGEVNSALSPSSSPHLCFCVRDTGIGIAPENIGKLFQAFVQIDSSLNRQYTGTGLGLALVQSIAALHGGTVSVESEVGRGSCFTVRLPYQVNGEVARMQAVTPLPNRSFPVDNAQVLIIEDSLAAAEQIARYLSECGMQPMIYPHGEGALEEVLRVKPALTILDIQLPNLSGWNVLTQLKTHPQTQDIPVLIVSVVDERSKALALGASEHLVKPLNREEFQATLKKLQYPTVPESTAPIVVPEPSSEHPLLLLAEDNQANIDTISGYLESRGYRLILANDGQQAIDMAKAHRPNLILMDIQMPGMDGLEAMRRIRAEGQTDVPIIALTALAMPSDQEKCLEAGADEYLAKPIKLKQLAATIQKLLLQRHENLP
jgi:PAS domain S-box-containing protein